MHSRVFNNGSYLTTAIEMTAEAYSEVLTATIEADEANTTVTFDGVDDEMLVDAFSNHALFLSIQAFRGGGDG